MVRARLKVPSKHGHKTKQFKKLNHTYMKGFFVSVIFIGFCEIDWIITFLRPAVFLFFYFLFYILKFKF